MMNTEIKRIDAQIKRAYRTREIKSCSDAHWFCEKIKRLRKRKEELIKSKKV